MAKSPLIGKMNNRAVSSENIIDLPSMTVEINRSDNSTIRKLDLTRLQYRNCDVSKGKPTLNRDTDIIKIAAYFHEKKATKKTLISTYHYIFNLLLISDKDDVNPFSKEGLINLSRHLWIKVQSFDPLKKLWNYENGEHIGIRESGAYVQLNKTRTFLRDILGYDANTWLLDERPFSPKGGTESHAGYDIRELKITTRRLTLYFTQLATKLIEFKRKGDSEDLIKVSIDSVDWLVPVTLEGRIKLNSDLSGLSPRGSSGNVALITLAFNQAMVAAYHLLSYFTAFNTSPLLGIRKPLIITEDKTEEWYQLDAFKGRSSSNVEALLGGKIHKKSLEFIKLLVSLSDSYNDENNGCLLYVLSNANNPMELDDNKLKYKGIIDDLDLTSSNKHQCIKHLCDMHEKFINSYQVKNYNYPRYRVHENKLAISVTATNQQGAMATRISHLAFAILDAVKLEENLPLKGIVLPIGIEDNGEFVNLSFRYTNGKQGNITIPSQYLSVVEKQLEFAFLQTRTHDARFSDYSGTFYDYTAMRLRKNHFSSPLNGYNPMYFIPFGEKRNYRQWRGISPKLSRTFSEIGIRSGDYQLNLNSSRMRETNGMIVRAKKGGTINDIASILQNSLQTVINNYGEDNKQQNFIVTSQGLQIIQELFTDADNNEVAISKEALEKAKKIVKEKLNVEVLEYDQYLELGRQQNGIGMHCNSPYDPNKTRKIIREADKANLLNKGEVLACHEYIDCVICIHSKLINDVSALYRLLSFINLLEEFRIYHLTEEHYRLNFGDTVSFFQEIINAKIPKITIQKAKLQLERQGRHPAWNDVQLVEQFIL